VLGVSAIGTTVHLAIAPWAQEGRLSVQGARCRASTSPWRSTAARRPRRRPAHAKVAGLYVICGIEKDRALKAGFDDALMLDWQGRIAETTGRQHLSGDRRQAGHPDAAQFPRRDHAPVR
jgi:branched-chain amino acid aminotransferase